MCVAGLTLEKSDVMGNHVWNDVGGETWNVRIGPNYTKNKKKSPSRRSLCDLRGLDLHASDKKIMNIGRFFNLPAAPYSAACEAQGLPQPPVFIGTFFVVVVGS
jgi:hypothetical protein